MDGLPGIVDVLTHRAHHSVVNASGSSAGMAFSYKSISGIEMPMLEISSVATAPLIGTRPHTPVSVLLWIRAAIVCW